MLLLLLLLLLLAGTGSIDSINSSSSSGSSSGGVVVMVVAGGDFDSGSFRKDVAMVRDEEREKRSQSGEAFDSFKKKKKGRFANKKVKSSFPRRDCICDNLEL